MSILLLILPVFDGSGLKDTDVPADSIDAIFSSFTPDTPGCALGINKKGSLYYSSGYGSANLDYGIAITPSSRFMIASISKQFAAASLFMLEQEGLLNLDEDLRSLIPEISQFDHPITARQLIHHTSGIRDIYNLLSIADIGLDNTTTAEQALEMLAKQEGLNFEPGSSHMYSNMTYFLMSVIVERFAGITLREHTQQHFFEPIGMNSTHWHDDTEKIVPDRVISYLPTSSGPGMFYRGNMDRVGARGLFTTIEDFSKWDLNFSQNKSNLENFREIMEEPGYTTSSDSINYAGGLRLGRYNTLPTVGHGGNYMGFRSNYVRFPGEDLSIFLFCNMSNISPGQYTSQVADLFLKHRFEDMFEPFTGTYQNTGLQSQFDVTLKDGSLYLNRPFHEPKELSWVDGNRFASGRWTVEFSKDEEGEISAFTVQLPRTGQITFTRTN